MLNGVFDRYKETSDNVAEFDRLVEFKMWSEGANPLEFTFGSGFGSFQNVLSFTNYHLHIGWFNLIYKGGIILVIGVLLAMIQNVRSCLCNYSDTTFKSVLFLNVLMAIHLLHSTSWGYSLDAMALSMSIYSTYNLKSKC